MKSVKKKRIIAGVFFLLAAALGIWILLRPKALGNMNHSCNLPETGLSRISFSADAGESFRVSFNTQAKAGTVAVRVRDAQENLVENLGQAKHLEIWVTFPEAGTYTLEAEYEDFVGSFQVRLFRKP